MWSRRIPPHSASASPRDAACHERGRILGRHARKVNPTSLHRATSHEATIPAAIALPGARWCQGAQGVPGCQRYMQLPLPARTDTCTLRPAHPSGRYRFLRRRPAPQRETKMATSTIERESQSPAFAARVAHKVWREVSRPFRAHSRHVVAPPVPPVPPPEPVQPYLTGSGVGVAGFHPQQATVEAEGIPLIQRLARESRRYPGPIVEVGTLLGITTTNLALAKAPQQKIITVDLYCWNPWGLAPDVHEALTSQMLYYLVETGHVERVRMDKNDFFRGYQGSPPAMVFLDAVHDYEETKKDIEWAQRAGAKIIAGHDYCGEFPGVKQVVDEFGGPRELGGTVWVL